MTPEPPSRRPHYRTVMSPSVRLSADVPTPHRVVVIVLMVLGSFVLLPLLGLVGMGLASSSGVVAIIGPLAMAVVAFAFLFVVVWAVCRITRSGAHLQGTELVVRGAFLTRRVDLATAHLLRVTNASSGWAATPLIPTLDAYNDGRGRSARVYFARARDGFLPLPEVEALVWAIRTGGRTGLAAQHAEHAIGELYLRAYAPNQARPS